MTDEQIAKSMAYKRLFAGEDGNKVLKDLERYGFYEKPDLCFDPLSDRVTCFNLGKAAIVRYIHQEIDRDLTKTKDNKAVHREPISEREKEQ